MVYTPLHYLASSANMSCFRFLGTSQTLLGLLLRLPCFTVDTEPLHSDSSRLPADSPVGCFGGCREGYQSASPCKRISQGCATQPFFEKWTQFDTDSDPPPNGERRGQTLEGVTTTPPLVVCGQWSRFLRGQSHQNR